MKSRILVAVVGVPVLVWVVLWAPTLVMMAALAILAGIGSWELVRCVNGGERCGWESVGVIFSMWAVWVYYKSPDAIAVFFVAAGVLVSALAVLEAGKMKFHHLTAILFGGIFLSYSFSAFLRMEAAGIHRAYLLLPFILSFACDTFAYFAGLAFGKHKLAPKVSPKKTIEGSIGGMAGNVVCGLLFAFVMDRWFGGSIGYGAMALLALLCGIVAQVGDLSFSLIKREFGIKDYGHLFLEHGGVLDRFDSVLFVTPIIEMVLMFALR